MNRPDLLPLLDHLAAAQPVDLTEWGGWQVQRIGGGANNLLYRARRAGTDLAIKFTIRDERDRAGREYMTLRALRLAGRDLAPEPVLLERERYAQPVVVQTWLAGAVQVEPPATDAEWRLLLGHFAAIHNLAPEHLSVALPPAVVNMSSAEAGKARFRDQLARIPPDAWPPGLAALVRRVDHGHFPTWPVPAPRLCRCDPNTLNFVRRPGLWASVDWENSGWGDPAFELGDLLAHPAYRTVDAARQAWVIATYCDLRGDPDAAPRIAVYYALMLAWWVAWLARTLYEVPRGLAARRLVARPADWQADLQAKYDDYRARALALLP